ncbi:glycosyltransferase family 4 protein [Mucilaginibacter sp. KACC 22063]|uniref:glycosyltransferase family 4 protein n=1 Tax=Mucilaginibacter sp. KACC 22063 TaxID=3025666 RepID=UPI002365D731|nr:glycosyltransferase family 1 protein [Mucilaginibacter sp. KACC 22063]WDF55169.1 glycosyltransferase family 1 protein [Mucilaginibacter sp. KACC 22063]
MANILYDHQTFSLQCYGGISRYFSALIAGIKASKHFDANVGLLYNDNYYLGIQKFAMENRMGSLLLGQKPSRAAKWNKWYSRYLIGKNNFDLLHPTYYHPYFLNALKKPYVITVHDMIYELLPDQFLPNDKAPQHKKETIKTAQGIIAISETTKRDLMQVLDVPEHQIRMIYHGIDPNFTSEAISGLPNEYILFVGDRSSYKNYKRLLQCFAELHKLYPELQLICTAGGNFTEEETQMHQRLGMEGNCKQMTVTDAELNYLYQHAIVFVYPSLYEGFGYPLLEAFRAGCPVAASNISALQEIGRDAIHGFDPSDVNSMFKAINDLINDSVLQEKLVKKGFERVKHFPIQQEIEDTLSYYNHIIA